MKKIFSLVLLIFSAPLLESMDKKLVSLSSPSSVIESKKKPLEVEYNPAALKRIQEQKPSSPTMKMAISTDKRKIATLDDKGVIQIWDAQSGKLLTNAGVTDKKNNQLMRFNDKGTGIIISDAQGTTEYPVIGTRHLQQEQKAEDLSLPLKEEDLENKPSIQTTQSSTSIKKESLILKELSSFDKPLSFESTSITKKNIPSSTTVGSKEVIQSSGENKTSPTTLSQPSLSSQEKSESTPSTETLANKKERILLKTRDSNHPTIATLDEKGIIQVWNRNNETLLTTLKRNYKDEKVSYLKFSENGTLLIIESPMGTTKTIVSTQPTRHQTTQKLPLEKPSLAVVTTLDQVVAFSPSGKVKAIFKKNDLSVKIYDTQTGEFISNLGQYSIGDATEELVSSIKFSSEFLIELLDSKGKSLHLIFLGPNYQHKSPERALLTGREQALYSPLGT